MCNIAYISKKKLFSTILVSIASLLAIVDVTQIAMSLFFVLRKKSFRTFALLQQNPRTPLAGFLKITTSCGVNVVLIGFHKVSSNETQPCDAVISLVPVNNGGNAQAASNVVQLRNAPG